jgi:Aspartyl protease
MGKRSSKGVDEMINRRHGLALLTFAAIAVAGQFALGQLLHHSVKDSNVIEEFDISVSRKLILVPVKLGGKNYQFAVDTGSSHMIYDSSLKSQLGPVREIASMRTPSGDSQIELFDAPQAFLGSFDLQTTERVCCSDLSSLRIASGTEVYGFIGMSFLRKHVIRVEIDNGKLVFLKKAGSHPGKQTIISDEFSMPCIEVELPRLGKRQFRVDTGYNLCMSLETKDFVDLLNKGEIKLGGQMKMTDVSRVQLVRKGVIKKASINGFDFVEVPVTECTTPKIRIGLQFLGGLHSTFDFPNNNLYLSENGRSANPRR